MDEAESNGFLPTQYWHHQWCQPIAARLANDMSRGSIRYTVAKGFDFTSTRCYFLLQLLCLTDCECRPVTHSSGTSIEADRSAKSVDLGTCRRFPSIRTLFEPREGRLGRGRVAKKWQSAKNSDIVKYQTNGFVRCWLALDIEINNLANFDCEQRKEK